MAIGPGIAGLDMENPGSAEWQKQRYLREVHAIREVKKIDLVEQILNDGTNKNLAQLAIIPGKTEYF